MAEERPIVVVKDLAKILSRVTEFSADSGTATGGSQTTCVDSTKNWEADMWKGAVIEIYSVADDIYYLRTISGNAATTITHAALPAGKAVASGDSYAIRLTIGLVDLDKVGGTTLTGRDISLDLRALTDDSIKGLLKSLGDVAALENLITRIGQTTDAIVAAGASGSVAAKLRRTTQGLEDLKTLIALSQLPAALTAAGNLKLSIEERLILKTTRDIAPGATGTFWLPETGNIDLSKYLASSWGIYAPTTATMVINCYLNISHDGGTTWRRAAGYEILDADFVRDVWNTIDCPLKLAEAKLEVVITVAHPAELDLMCIAKP